MKEETYPMWWHGKPGCSAAQVGTKVEYHKYKNLGHGFGLGTGTSAEVWVFEAIRFWETSIDGARK
jgi:hypothetical protein